MKEFTIKELSEFINSINKTEDAIIDVNVKDGTGVVGALCGDTISIKITPQKTFKIQ